MAEPPSLRVMIGNLQRAAAFHREREAFHARQQAHHAQQKKIHGEERARPAEELAAASRDLEELQEMAERLGQVVQESRLVPPETTPPSEASCCIPKMLSRRSTFPTLNRAAVE